ncbi:MAG TPA: TIGR01459 family HAD-type hydrolase [Sphingomicrobium sp.]|jgi:HAD superfamily hydrolase (TIGR01459 family)
MSYLDALPERYRLILCDIWGVVHDGVTLYAGAADRLQQWRGEGRTVVLITNAPRTAEAVEQQLLRLGLPREAWDGVATSGEAGIAALKASERPVGFIGTRSDREILEGRDVEIASRDDFTELACTGLDDERSHVEDYRAQLEHLADRDVLIHCLNPDRVVIRGGVPEPCAGALADLYLGLGGRVEWYGKPFPAIYRHALKIAGNPPADEVLAIGDALQTDVLGAAKMGFDAVFVAGGIHAGEPFPSDFGPENGLGDWEPVAVVDALR